MSAPRQLRCAGVTVRAVVFDFDGTLAVPTLDFGVMRRAVAEAMAAHLTPPERPDLPVMEWIAHTARLLEERSPVGASALHAEAHAAIRRVEVQAAARGSLFPFTRPMLAALAAMGVPVAIVTRNCPEAVRAVFPDVDALCPCLLTRDDVPSVKPDPDHLLRALDGIGRAPGEALMVGDHPMDIVTGRRAGTLTAGVASGESPADALHAAGADMVADHCGDLMARLGLSGMDETGGMGGMGGMG
ncbi:HAD family hydrolase [Nitratidesulfovibrio sp. HK-II]|uniref:HAD family hydrolase n=1 Tax=Nitratidesulfovibrio sp. HK-II TaxID=2009266 RepID=UPI000E2FA2AD|nr:HAD family hydrolase [Nitratidesulfovibrio sp. HK-II]GBO96213.1 hydrolase [Nitratidesulfovibrio sp. HK-II]